MDIPLDADVQCVDELAGHSRRVIVDPIRQQVTHFVVEEKDNPSSIFICRQVSCPFPP
jgi:hypothetical protein